MQCVNVIRLATNMKNWYKNHVQKSQGKYLQTWTWEPYLTDRNVRGKMGSINKKIGEMNEQEKMNRKYLTDWHIQLNWF